MTMTRIVNRLCDFQHNEDGATAIEYAIIASGIAAAIIAVVFTLGTGVHGKFQSVSDVMK